MKMKFSESTLAVLKNFASINPNIYFTEGNVLKTIKEGRRMFAVATLEDEIPMEFGIYNLNQFLSVINLLGDPIIEYVDEDEDTEEPVHILIKNVDQRKTVKMYLAHKDDLQIELKNVVIPKPKVQFLLTQETMAELRAAAGALKSEQLVISNHDSETILLTVCKAGRMNMDNSYTVEIPVHSLEDEAAKFNFVLDMAALSKIHSGEYAVGINDKMSASFKSTQQDFPVEYFFSLEEKGSFYGDKYK